MSKDVSLMVKYDQTVRSEIRRQARVAFLIGGIMYLVFGFLDVVMFPLHAEYFFWHIRCPFSIVLFLGSFLCHFKKSERFVHAIIFIVLTLAWAGLAIMISIEGGSSSDYYYGLVLVLLCHAVVDMFSPARLVYFSTTNFMLYFVFLNFSVEKWDSINFVEAFFYILSAVIFVVVLSRLYSLQFFKQFTLSEELMRKEKLLSQAYKMLKIESTKDELSGILNRRSFTEVIENKIKLSDASGQSFYLIFFDIDGFKQVNDRYDHTTGDRVIRAISEAVSQHLRANTAFGRYGGDEFVLILDHANEAQIQERLASLKALIESLVFNYENIQFGVTSSFGVARYEPSSGQQVADLISRADHAMLNVKRSGKAGIAFG